MLGLEYILYIYNMQHQSLSDIFNIRKQNINKWVKGKQGIPKKYISEIEKMFGIPQEYFQKELTEVDKLKIQKFKLIKEFKKPKFTQLKLDLNKAQQGGIPLEEEPLYNNKILAIETKIRKMEFLQKFIDDDEIFYDDIDDLEELYDLYKKIKNDRIFIMELKKYMKSKYINFY